MRPGVSAFVFITFMESPLFNSSSNITKGAKGTGLIQQFDFIPSEGVVFNAHQGLDEVVSFLLLLRTLGLWKDKFFVVKR